jgi:2'-5' RNA ligase
LPLPDAVRTELARVGELMEPHTLTGRFIPAENLHLTLAYLGNVEDERVAAVGEAVSGAARGQGPIATSLAGLGAFPSPRRARVLWAGLADPHGRLRALATAVQEALEPLGFEREDRPFRAHVTLARLRLPRPVDVDHVPVEPRAFTIEQVVLFRSHLGRGFPRYEAMTSVRLV